MKNYKADVNERVITVVKNLISNKIIANKREFCTKFNITPSKFSEILAGRMFAGIDIIQNLCNDFNISAEWLLTGKGEMLKQDSNTPLPSVKGDNNINVSGNNNSNIHSGTDKDTTVVIQQLQSLLTDKDKTINLLTAEIEKKNKQIDTLLSILQNNGKQQ